MGRIVEALSRVPRRLLAAVSDSGQDDRGARSLRLSSAGAGPLCRGKKSRRLCRRFGDLRAGSDRSRLRPRRRAGRDRHHRSRRRWNRSNRFRRCPMPSVFSNTFISRGPTANSSATTFIKCARRSAASWRGRAASTPIWSRRCRTPACRRRSAIAEESKIPLEFGLIRNHYVGRTFIEPQQTIRNFGVKIKLNAQRDVLATASASSSSTTRSCAAPPAARSSACCATPAPRKCTCASARRRRSARAITASTRRPAPS